MDRRTLIAVAVCLGLLFAYPTLVRWAGFGNYLEPPKPPAGASRDSGQVVRDTGGATPSPASVSSTPAPVAAGAPAASAPPASGFRPMGAELERTYVIETPLYRATFSNRGARLLSVELKQFAASHGPSFASTGKTPVKGREVAPADRVMLSGNPSFAVDLGSGESLRPLDDVVYGVAESRNAAGTVERLTFTAVDSSGLLVRQTWQVHPNDYALDLEVELRDVPDTWRLSSYSLTCRSWPLLNEHNLEDEEHSLRATSQVGTSLRREGAGGMKKAPKRFDGNVQWVAVQTRYFMGGVAVVRGTAQAAVGTATVQQLPAELARRLPPETSPEQDVVSHTLVMGLPGETNPVNRFMVYFGPNDHFRLAKLKVGFDRLVDLGWAWLHPFSELLLRVLNALNAVVRNYGIAIILLATVVRVLLHPLNMMSMRSMRSMQKLQPEIERLRKKYEKDPQALNTAIMAAYKENKVNPAGGCLPMLVQMPIFFALYAVLFNAIELRHAPFVSWIHDLSAPDTLFMIGPFPLRLLPLIMAASGILSQKLTPTDPRQAPTMYLMNVMMVVFFYGVPSGLVLYWTVMNLLTAVQQWLVLREPDSNVVQTPVARKA
jgi:YidC/Oxa1 family membrane protein insertase